MFGPMMPTPPRRKTEEEKNVVHQRLEWTVANQGREYRFSAPGGAPLKEALEACSWFLSRLEVIMQNNKEEKS